MAVVRRRFLIRRAGIAFLREAAVLLLVFGAIDGMTGHEELLKLDVVWWQWMIGLFVLAFFLFLLSVVLERDHLVAAKNRRRS